MVYADFGINHSFGHPLGSLRMYPQNIRGDYCIEGFQCSQKVLRFECQHGTPLEIVEEGSRKWNLSLEILVCGEGVEAGGQVRPSGCNNSRKKP